MIKSRNQVNILYKFDMTDGVSFMITHTYDKSFKIDLYVVELKFFKEVNCTNKFHVQFMLIRRWFKIWQFPRFI